MQSAVFFRAHLYSVWYTVYSCKTLFLICEIC
jgi:hypothetical protein